MHIINYFNKLTSPYDKPCPKTSTLLFDLKQLNVQLLKSDENVERTNSSRATLEAPGPAFSVLPESTDARAFNVRIMLGIIVLETMK